ncbi:tyrosine-type recombinase/integrase [Halobacteriovorax marinus]|uniref:tyrosine-type recombinase/integrase n=1 Tax=Halobacteriovorax marinus TaxID=97084 RepID=UPI003A92123E
MALHRNKSFVHIRDFYLIHTFLETGLRVAELASLKAGDFQSKSLTVQNGKGGKRRTVILSQATQKMLKQFLKIKKQILCEPTTCDAPLFISERKSHYTTRGIRKRIKFWFSKCNLPENLSCHSCRHTYVSHLIAAGVDLQTVRANVGHASLGTTSLYGYAVKEELGIELYQ